MGRREEAIIAAEKEHFPIINTDQDIHTQDLSYKIALQSRNTAHTPLLAMNSIVRMAQGVPIRNLNEKIILRFCNTEADPSLSKEK